MKRSPIAAEHEAAHVVVGLSVGLKLRRVELGPDDTGGTWFRGPLDGGRRRVGFGMMYAAGLAICKTRKWPEWHARQDRAALRALGFTSDDIRLLSGVVARFLETDLAGGLVQTIARALVERDLTGAEVSAILSGDE